MVSRGDRPDHRIPSCDRRRPSDEDDDSDNEADARPQESERIWNFQCKREKEIGPTKLSEIVSESIPEGSESPYGFVVAAACDFWKASRERFRAEQMQRGVQEFYLWGKADLEDMLFLPKNDHLLFAYFNISIQVRRRSRRSQIRGRLATKKSLYRLLGKDRDTFNLFEPVLIRDVSVEMPLSSVDINSLVESRPPAEQPIAQSRMLCPPPRDCTVFRRPQREVVCCLLVGTFRPA